MPEEDKAKMQKMYENEKDAYAIKLAKVPQEVLDNAKLTKADKKSKKVVSLCKREAEAELKSLLERLKKPKKPATAYVQFCFDMRPHLSANLKVTEKMKQLGKEWTQASNATKEKYENGNSEKLVKYQKELEKWSMKMHAQGKTEEIATAQMKVAQAKKSAKVQGSV